MLVGSVGQRGNQLRSNEFFKIHVKHIPTGETVSFEGFVTQFSDTYTAQWNEEQVYGRMDPLATYQGTKRGITLGFDIPNDSKVMATFNMRRIQKLIQFMYPVYESGDLSVQNVLQAAPLLTLKWTNLISSVNNEGEELVGYINGPISYAPDVGEGGFLHSEVIQQAAHAGQLHAGSKEQIQIKDIRNYFPKKISMNFNFTVLHTHLLGWSPTGEIEDWGDASEELIAAQKDAGHGPKNTTTTYSFGGSTDIGRRFPNVYKAPPPPAPLQPQQGEEQLAADAARQQEIAEIMDELPPRQQAAADRMDVDQILKQQRDREASERRMLHRGLGGNVIPGPVIG